MTYVADLHLHSSYAAGTSPSLTLDTLAQGAHVKGIDLLASADFTHPVWLRHLRSRLAPRDDGLFDYGGRRFILGTELSCVYQEDGRGYRLHVLAYAPDFDAVDRIVAALRPFGNLASDGRPALSLSGRDAVDAVLSADARCVVIPAHVWTPWFSALGSKGGYGSLAACFRDMLPHISAVETGLSSDPAMNWRVPELDRLALVSFSDAHSVGRLGRELTVFDGDCSYDGFVQALQRQAIAWTAEFYPEEGKYHFDGHRPCRFRQDPNAGGPIDRCPACGKKVTWGVAHRVRDLAARDGVALAPGADGLIRDPLGRRPPFRRLVPLQEVIAEALERGVTSRAVVACHAKLVDSFGSELRVLTEASWDEIAAVAGERVAEGVLRCRRGEVVIEPGYDGVYGTVRIWPPKRPPEQAVFPL